MDRGVVPGHPDARAFHEAYLGVRDPELEAAGRRRRRYDLFVVCDPATPFVQDHTLLREDGERRLRMHERYREYVASQPAPAVFVTGTPEERCTRRSGLSTGSFRSRAASSSERARSQETCEEP